MGKKSINEKLTSTHQLTMECTLNADALVEGILKGEFEELGEVDLVEYIRKFNGQFVKISITNKVEETPEE